MTFLFIIQIAIIYVIYLLIVILGGYYVNLFQTKEQFTKDELKDIVPYLKELWITVQKRISVAKTIIILLVSSFIGLIIPFLSFHWLINSALFVIAAFFGFPVLKKNFEKSQVTESGDYSDTAMNIFVRFNDFIILGFGTGFGSAMIYNWGSLKVINFLWFFINIAAISIFLGLTIKNIINIEDSPQNIDDSTPSE